jgi:dCMP deaminase
MGRYPVKLPGGQLTQISTDPGPGQFQVVMPEHVDWDSIAEFMAIEKRRHHPPHPFDEPLESLPPGTFPDEEPEERISTDELFIRIAELVRLRSTCLRGRVGTVAVRDNRIVATGYNGSPPGAPHCTEVGCDIPANDHSPGCQRTIHAEANCIAWAARAGVQMQGATVYCTHSPCLKCAQLLLSAGIERFVYARDYRLGRPDLLADAGIYVQCYDGGEVTDWYPQQRGF